MNKIETDVLIVGGGPSGASAALSLLKYFDSRIILVEQSDFDRILVGEQVSSSIFDLLDYIDLCITDFEDGCFLPSYGSMSFWGSEYPSYIDAIFTTEQSSYQLNRDKFDLTLIKKISERGGNVFPRTKCTRFFQRDNGDWEVSLKHPMKGEFIIVANFLIDATGRQASVSRQIGVHSKRIDALMGVGAFLKLDNTRKLKQNRLIETTEHGWWHSAVLPDNLMTLTFFSDADIISRNKINKSAFWNDCLQSTYHTRERAKGGVASDSKPWVRNAFTQIVDSTKAENFMAIGDAATSFDPISSMGIGFGISSAFQSTLIVSSPASQRNQKIVVYQNGINSNFENYLSLKKNVYAQEKRWTSSEFWVRRS